MSGFNDVSSCFHLHGVVDDHDDVDDGVDDDDQRDQVVPCSQELLWGDHAGLLKLADNHQTPNNWIIGDKIIRYD